MRFHVSGFNTGCDIVQVVLHRRIEHWPDRQADVQLFNQSLKIIGVHETAMVNVVTVTIVAVGFDDASHSRQSLRGLHHHRWRGL